MEKVSLEWVRRLGAVGVLVATTLATGTAKADGDGVHGLTFSQSSAGLSVATASAGLAGRKEGVGSVPVPVTEVTLKLEDLPAGATIVQAYLYWVVYGAAGDAVVTFDEEELTGTLIGTSGHTCWAEVDTNTNFVYRADVTARVAGNADYDLADFPSGATGADSQGASLVVVYEDPADPFVGDVQLYDGAITVNPTSAVDQTFASLTIPPVVQSATFRVGVGDGQATFVDGPLSFKSVGLPQADGIQYYKSTAGLYWDVVAWDVTSQLKPSDKEIRWTQEYMQDCLVFAFSQLEVHREIVDNDGDDVDDGADNCVDTPNTNQADSDDDGVGDACDDEGSGGAGSGGDSPGAGGVPSSSGGSGAEGGGSGDGDGDGDGVMVGDGGRSATGNGGETAVSMGGQNDGSSTSDARSSDPSGCGCRTQGRGGGSGAYVLLLLALLGLRRRWVGPMLSTTRASGLAGSGRKWTCGVR